MDSHKSVSFKHITCFDIKTQYKQRFFHLQGHRFYNKDRIDECSTVLGCHSDNYYEGQSWVLTQVEPGLYIISYAENSYQMIDWKLYVQEPDEITNNISYPVIVSSVSFSLWILEPCTDTSFRIKDSKTDTYLSINTNNQRDICSYYIHGTPRTGNIWTITYKKGNVKEYERFTHGDHNYDGWTNYQGNHDYNNEYISDNDSNDLKEEEQDYDEEENEEEEDENEDKKL